MRVDEEEGRAHVWSYSPLWGWAGLVGGAAAVALTLGLGAAHADTVDQLAGIAVAGGSSDSTGLLIIASTNFLDAKDIYTGIDTAGLSDSLLSAVAAFGRYPSIVDRVVDIVDGKLEPAESTILAHTGSMSAKSRCSGCSSPK